MAHLKNQLYFLGTKMILHKLKIIFLYYIKYKKYQSESIKVN